MPASGLVDWLKKGKWIIIGVGKEKESKKESNLPTNSQMEISHR